MRTYTAYIEFDPETKLYVGIGRISTYCEGRVS
jgi:hypothetical protein